VSSIATLIKATLALENGVIPPTAAFKKPNAKSMFKRRRSLDKEVCLITWS
jgi:acyl transferase domain-containing protein